MTGRRRWFLYAAIAYLVIICAVVLGLGRLYTASQTRLDEAMGDRLLAVANSLAVMTEASEVFAVSIGDTTAQSYVDSLARKYHRVGRRDNLAEITLCDPDGVVLLSTSAGQTIGHANDYWALDPAAVEMAGQGFAQSTRLYRLQETFQKSAHAPVLLHDPLIGSPLVVAIVTVSGNPDFFDALATLRKGAFVTGTVVLVILVLMGFFLYRIELAVQRYRASIMRQETLATMGRMTAGIAHEIRNPLGIIRGAGQHLQRVLDEAKINDPVATFIPEEVDRLDQILSGYLAFGADGPLVQDVFAFGAGVRQSVAMIQPELQAGQVTVQITDLPADVQVLGDPRRLQQVLLNVLLNARDAMPKGGAVIVAAAVRDSEIVLTISDQGCGLDGVEQARLFEPFWTSKEKGSGLGLAMSRRIIEQMNGSLDLCDNPDGPGAVATIVLPIQQKGDLGGEDPSR